jgi:hypothetical protein
MPIFRRVCGFFFDPDFSRTVPYTTADDRKNHCSRPYKQLRLGQIRAKNPLLAICHG